MSRARKELYFQKLKGFLEEYSKAFLITIDNIGASHIQSLRKQFRGKAEILMGKNTMIRKCMKQCVEAGMTKLEPFIEKINGNVGIVFTNGDLSELKDLITATKKPAPAKAGVVAPSDVILPAGPTGLEPTATVFLQALNIQSKIVRGQVELTVSVHLIEKGEKVKAGAAALLQKLGITPFEYGIQLTTVYDNGFVYGAELLDLTDADVLGKFSQGITRIAALGMQIGYPTIATVPHTIAKAFQNLLAIGIETEYSFGPVDELKATLADPDAFKAVATTAAVEEKVEVAAVVEESSSSEEMDLDLFG